MAIKDPSTFTETGDDGVTTTGIFQENTTRADFIGLPRNAEKLLSEAGSYSGSAYVEGTLHIGSISGANQSVVISFGDSNAAYPTVQNEVGLDFFANASTVRTLRSWLTQGGSLTVVSAYTQAEGLAIGDTLGYRTGFLSSIKGQYGGAFTQVFSTAARTTLLGGATQARTAALSYTQFNAVAGVNAGSADTITGYNENFEVFQPAAGEDLTADSNVGAALAVYPDIIVATALPTNSTTQRNQKDGGAGYYSGNYTVKGALQVTAQTGTDARFGVLALTNTADDYIGSTNSKHYLDVKYNSSTNVYVKLTEVSGGVEYQSTAIPYVYADGPVWPKMWRDTTIGTYGRLYGGLFSDPACTIAYGSPVQLDLHENIDFRYRDAVIPANKASTATSTFTIGGVSATPGGTTVAVGQATETDTAQPITVASSVAIALGQATETDTAQAISTGVSIAVAVGQATETGTAQSITPIAGAVTVAVGQATETDSAQSITPSVGGTITNINVSSDATNLTVTFDTSIDLSSGVVGFGYSINTPTTPPLTSWIDEAGAVTNQSIVIPWASLGAVSGDTIYVDCGYSLTNPAGVIVYASDEGTAVSSVVVLEAGIIVIGQATETDTAQAITPSQPVVYIAIGQATETDSAQSIAPITSNTIAVGQATESDTALPLTLVYDLIMAIGQASETDTAQAITVTIGAILKHLSYEFRDHVTGALKSGLVPKVKVRNSKTGLSYDHDDYAFKAAASCTLLEGTMTEDDPTHYGGTYEYYLVVTADWGAGEDTVYQIFVADEVNGYFARPDILVYRDGVEQWGGLNSSQNTVLNSISAGNGLTLPEFIALK